jgi:hypothetical protein
VRSVSPAVKQTIGKIVASSGARFVEVAVMAPLAPHAHRVPMLAGGPAAKAFADAMTPHGMRVDVLDGAATAVPPRWKCAAASSSRGFRR